MRDVVPARSVSGNSAFTFIEVLITVSIFSIGIAFIFRILCETSSTYRHVSNRVKVNNILDGEICQMRSKLMKDLVKISDFSERKTVSGMSPIEISSRISRDEEYPDMCKLTADAEWREGRRSVSLSRTLYVYDEK